MSDCLTSFRTYTVFVRKKYFLPAQIPSASAIKTHRHSKIVINASNAFSEAWMSTTCSILEAISLRTYEMVENICPLVR